MGEHKKKREGSVRKKKKESIGKCEWKDQGKKEDKKRERIRKRERVREGEEGV